MVGIVALYFIGSLIGVVGYYVWRGTQAVIEGPEPLAEWEMPAGRIHLLAEDRYFDSSVTNAYEHPSLNWVDGRIGCAFANELQAHPALQAALIGTIQVHKPQWSKGHVAVILDNQIVQAMGFPPVGLISEAQDLVDRIVPKQTLRVH